MSTKTSISHPIRLLTASAMCLALCLVLPFLTGQIPQIGSALLPMHIPVLLCGYLCGPWWALLVGICAPLLRHLLFGMPPLLTAMAMSAELAGYGAVCGILYRKFPKNLPGIYLSLIVSMIAGRILWGIAMVFITGIGSNGFSWSLFVAGALTNAIPGIILQLILIPILVSTLRKANFIE
ncbi:MAG: ECF transporter S component [Oscillospiraceae bacterium]|nr:ECF transporter S component [Oscillospiraceae bacterium]